MSTTTTHEPGGPTTTPPRRPSPLLGPVRIAGVVLGLGVLGLGVMTVVTQFATRVHEETFTVSDPVTTLSVDVGSGDVRVRAVAEGTPVRVEVKARSAIRDAVWNHTVDDGRLAVTADCRGGWPIDSCSVSLTITVPENVPVDLHTGSGDQEVRGLTADVKARAGSGDIDLTGLTGDILATSGSGDVRASSMRSVVNEMRTGSGDVRADFIGDAVRLVTRTGSGDVRVGFSTAPTSVSAKTGAGNVQLTVPNDGTRYDVSGTTGSGDRRIDVPTVGAKGSGNPIEADTGSGDVVVSYR
ncbi:DUF4097 family beta strand repeat-containing protein [Kineosporia succinea]|uniref:DUF4097 domain-containing protein n=1 Tax=Kineosporia succinea TaxID=84632 RepID=A0ABT9P4A1_9ACTN|nr:DUF4097 family beta strand repeat-containing protein [Kineosporia succinea]MDP9827526.1 hypothetical protein [Kineosporia succinea]